MHLSADDVDIALRILGYEFPHGVSDIYDRNWLICEGSAKCPRGSWRFRDPCLLTWEVEALADWLEAVAAHSAAYDRCEFIEPNLAFKVSGDRDRRLRIEFAYESRPPWVAEQETEILELPISESDLKRAAASLRDQLERFPRRGDR